MIYQPGIYFGLPEDEYHSIPALSSSGLKWLRLSPLDFWVRSRWNPNLAQVLAEEGESEAMTLGKAFDCRIVEGKAAFDARYVRKIVADDYPGCLETNDDLKAELRRLDQPVSGNKDVLIERVLAANPDAVIWEMILRKYGAQHVGKEFLSQRWIEKIETAAAMIEKHPTLCHAFTGGMPQVSIVFDCKQTGIRCKARLDYLKPKAIVDLKTIDPRDKPLDVAIAREIASRRYHIQAAMYDEAASHVPAFIKQERVWGEVDPAFLAALRNGDDKTFLFVFQKKGVAPVARGITLPKTGMTFQIGQREIENGKGLFLKCVEKYGYDLPWVSDEPIEALDDARVPSWSLE